MCAASARGPNESSPERWLVGGIVIFRASGGPGSRIKSVRIQSDNSKTVAENASKKLPELARAFLAAGTELAGRDASFEALHQFRLLTKRFRYALELFRACYGPGLESRIEALREL